MQSRLRFDECRGDIANINANVSLTNQERADQTARVVAGINADTSLAIAQRQDESARAIEARICMPPDSSRG